MDLDSTVYGSVCTDELVKYVQKKVEARMPRDNNAADEGYVFELSNACVVESFEELNVWDMVSTMLVDIQGGGRGLFCK